MFLDVGVAGDVASDLAAQGLDACTLNNALNIAQLIALVAVVKWLREDRESKPG